MKAGIIKPDAAVVSAAQEPAAEAVLRAQAQRVGATIAFEGQDFALTADRLAVGGQMLDVRGLAGEYNELYLPIYGAHQGRNAALAIAAVESLIGGASRSLVSDIVTEGFAQATSPGRLQLVGSHPT
ncbi:MAG: dihydrofolate synthase, partial [Microbacterium sp.]|nr:dihydrofolate synthase [Microbacterium sp.]